MDEDQIISKGGWQWYKENLCKALWHLWDRKHMVALPSCCGNLPALDESGMKKRGDLDE
jgi:hypothetical protein